MRARARRQAHNAFLKALLSDDTEGMNEYMNEVSCELFSSFDTGKKLPEKRSQSGFITVLSWDLWSICRTDM